MALPHLVPQHRREVTPVDARLADASATPPVTVADVARVLHLDAAHADRAIVLWSQVIGVPADQLMGCVVDEGNRDPGPPQWVVERTRPGSSSR